MIVTTPRLIIRPWQRADLDALAALPRYPDPLDSAWNWPHMLQEQGTADIFFLSRATDSRRREWTITLQDGQVIGSIGIRNMEQDERSARLGFGFGYPYIGQGYGVEALTAFLDTFFGALGFSVMRLDVADHNLRARRLYERLGFRKTGTFWQEVGLVSDFQFLDEPRYDALRPSFRRGAHAMLLCYIQMELEAEDWRVAVEE